MLVFGLGMIGQAVVEAAQRLGFEALLQVGVPWHDAKFRQRVVTDLMNTCAQRIGASRAQLSIVWSAGQAGFLSSENEVRDESRVFEGMLDWAESLQQALTTASIQFHFLSSAGGLFEGQQAVGPESQPSPLRPYGELKLAQERMLAERFAAGTVSIYRPSSAYGPHGTNRRHGLINHLVNNSRRGRTTVLDSRVMALRDYVYSGDIGLHISRRIRFGRPERQALPAQFLVSARCASIFEVVRKIERVLKLRIPVRYDEHFGNHSHITFSERVLPPGWRPVSLETGIRQFLVHPGHRIAARW